MEPTSIYLFILFSQWKNMQYELERVLKFVGHFHMPSADSAAGAPI
jgi:hypothetical protein